MYLPMSPVSATLWTTSAGLFRSGDTATSFSSSAIPTGGAVACAREEIFSALCARCGQEKSGAPDIALALRQDWVSTGLSRQHEKNVEALRHRHAEAPPANRLNGVAIDRYDRALQSAKVDVEGARGGTIDDPQPNTASALDCDNLRILERAIVGKERVVLDIVEIESRRSSWCRTRHSGRGAHTGHGWLGCRSTGFFGYLAALSSTLEVVEDFSWIAEREIREQYRDFLNVGPNIL